MIGLDNLNKYYDLNLKKKKEIIYLKDTKSTNFYKVDINKKNSIDKIFKKKKIDIVIHLAAQAGVRYSIINPSIYVNTNFVGFHNIIQNCVDHKIKKFIFASSSSIYGLIKKQNLKKIFLLTNPYNYMLLQKKSNELVAHAYSSLYDLKCVGLRFFLLFTVHGVDRICLFLNL